MDWRRHLGGHVLLFDRKPLPELSGSADMRLLLLAAALEIGRLAVFRRAHPALVLAWLALALLAVPSFARVRLRDLGFAPWRAWTGTERSYFVQVLVLANVLFPLVLARRPGRLFVVYLGFGFYQELVYRGMLQRALTGRWPPLAAIATANLLYTFGPLHWNYLRGPASVAAPMLVAIFAIGLLFGALYHRSGNLWIPAVFHAVGNAWLVGVGYTAPS